MRFKKRAWSRLVRIQAEGKVSWSAYGITTGRGSKEPLGVPVPASDLFGGAGAARARARCAARSCRSWILCVCSADSSIESSKQRVAFSWLTVLAVVASMKAARASTVKILVRMFPVCGSLIGRGGDELLPALEHPDRVVRFDRAAALLDDHELPVQESGLGVVEALRRESGQEHDVLGRAELLDHLGEAALAGPALGEHDRGERIVELAGDGHEVEKPLVRRPRPRSPARRCPCATWSRRSGRFRKARASARSLSVSGCTAAWSSTASWSAAFSATTTSARSAASTAWASTPKVFSTRRANSARLLLA